MRDQQLARSYADALYDAAFESWLKQLAAVQQGLQDNPRLLDTVRDPSIEFAQKSQPVLRLLPPDADKEVRNFVQLLVSRDELKLLPAVIEAFTQRMRGGPARKEGEITSAMALSPDDRADLERKLRAAFGEDVEFKYKVDPAILGGLIVRVGDKVMDASVASKLSALREKIVAAL